MQLFRFFSDKDHLCQFKCGHVRFTLLDFYKNTTEKSRHDQQEGIGITQCKGVTHTSIFRNPTYILSTSTVSNEELRARFGNYVATISDGTEFLKRVNSALPKYYIKYFKEVKSGLVNYTKSMEANGHIQALDSILQKDHDYHEECEYRFYFISKETKPPFDHLEIKIEDPESLISQGSF